MIFCNVHKTEGIQLKSDLKTYDNDIVVLVTGGRNFSDNHLLWSNLLAINIDHFNPSRRWNRPIGTIVTGGAKGADSIAGSFARECGIELFEFKPNWKLYGKRAGPLRNSFMVKEAKQMIGNYHICVVCPGGRGTADCERKAIEAGFEMIYLKEENT